eukprot:6196970-Pleurochrysis_carterae.AAC.2
MQTVINDAPYQRHTIVLRKGFMDVGSLTKWMAKKAAQRHILGAVSPKAKARASSFNVPK